MKRFIDLAMVVGIFSLAFVIPIGLNRLTTGPQTGSPSYAETTAEGGQTFQGTEDTKIPLDIPVPDGASLIDSKQIDRNVDLLTFSLPKTSMDNLAKYYLEEMDRMGWTKFEQDDNVLKFHKEDGQRKVCLTFIPSPARPKLSMEIEQNW